MKSPKAFFTRKKELLRSFCSVVLACITMSAALLPYRAFMRSEAPRENEDSVPASISVFRPAGIAYDLECDLLARFISALAEKEPYVCQVSIGAAVVNRRNNVHFSDDIASVIFNFSPYFSEDILEKEPSERSRRAARDALMGVDPSGGALYFCTVENDDALPISRKLVTASYGNYRFAK